MGGRIVDFVTFYQVSIIAGMPDKDIEPDGLWDMGPSVKDGVHFPLSDSWRSVESRKLDCTYRIKKLLADIEMHDRPLSIPGTD